MLDATADRDRGVPPRLLICGFGAFPAAPRNPAATVVEQLQARRWAPADARALYTVLPTLWDSAAEAVRAAALDGGATGILLVGVAVKASAFRVEMRGSNRTSAKRTDAAGRALGRDRISVVGPASARATAPVAAMVSALRQAGLEAGPSSDAGAYLCNYTLYRTLTEVDADGPTAGFLHVPNAREFADDGRGKFALADIERGVRAAAEAYAAALSGARARVAA